MSTIPLILVSIYYITQNKVDLEDRITDHQRLLIESFANEIEAEMNQTYHRLKMLSTVNDIENQLGLFYDTLHQSESIEEIVVFNEAGAVTQKVSRLEINEDGINERWINQSMKENLLSNKEVYGEVEFNQYVQPVIKLAVPIYSSDSQTYSGGIGVTIQLQKIIGEISSHRMENAGTIYLIDKSDRIIAHQDYTQFRQQKTKQNNEVLGLTTKIESLDWELVMEQPVRKAFSPIYDMIQRGFIVVLFVILIVSLVSIYAGLYFTRPIELLQKAMKKIQRGHWSEPVEVDRSDELGELANSFNGMSKELKDKSEHLLQEKERLNIIVESIGAGLALVRSDFQVSWMNSTLKNWLHDFPSLELPCYRLFNEQDSPCNECPIIEESTRDSDDMITTIQKNGEKKIFRHRVYRLIHAVHSLDKFLIVLEDITEQRKMEEKLIQTDKLSALGLMASSFAHEVNNPLATINVYAEDLLDRIEEEADELVKSREINKYLKIIKENTERCKKITSNLLNFSRKSEWNRKHIDVNEIIHNSISLVQYTFSRKNIHVEQNLDESLPLVFGDSLKLMQVFVNVINNAVDAMEDSGTLTISTGLHKNELVIHIEDTGSGIPEEHLSKVFDPFYTSKPVGKGTGLGLSVCYGLIQQFGGAITIQSEVEVGTVVEIKIPA